MKLSENRWEWSGLLNANLIVENRKGEVVLALKRKGEGENVYYIFELHKDKVEKDKLERFEHTWELIKDYARIMNIPLFNSDEIRDKIKEIMSYRSFTEGETVEVEIPLINHATNQSGSLKIDLRLEKVKKK